MRISEKERSLSHRELLRVLHYDKATGEFTKIGGRGGGARPKLGMIGSVMANGYYTISVHSRHYLAHRLAWFYIHGEWPTRFVEHINGDKLDNRIENLRLKWSDRNDNGEIILTQKRVREILSYDPDTGIFRWRVSTGPRCKVGDEAGVIGGPGYRYMSIDGRKVLAHRLVWLWVHGYWPSQQIDHINRIRTDNRLANLREATPLQNRWNASAKKDSTTGFKGIFRKGKRWGARIMIDYRLVPLGIFDTPQEAAAAYEAASKMLHGEFSRAGKEVH